jgi:hypothetical protein
VYETLDRYRPIVGSPGGSGSIAVQEVTGLLESERCATEGDLGVVRPRTVDGMLIEGPPRSSRPVAAACAPRRAPGLALAGQAEAMAGEAAGDGRA